MNWNTIRDLFTGTKGRVFLDSAAIGLSPVTAKASISQFLDLATGSSLSDVSQVHTAIDEAQKNVIRQIASMLNTDIKNIALIENTTDGLNIACNIIPWCKNDQVIICNTEYLQVAIPFLKKQEKNELKVIPLVADKNGHFLLDDFEQKIGKDTKAICISAVQWCTGQRTFTKELGDLCRNKKIWLIVDGVQEAGALHTDLQEKYCDFYIAGGHKWLNSPYGCGFIYISPKAQNLEPTEFGYLNLATPEHGWNNFFQDPHQTPFREYRFPVGAQSFSNGGTGNAIGAIGLCEAIKIVNEAGPSAIEARVLQLTNELRENLELIGAKLMPLPEYARSGITIFRLGPHSEEGKIIAALKDQGIFLSIRYTNGHGGLRASTNYFNNSEDIHRLCHALKM